MTRIFRLQSPIWIPEKEMFFRLDTVDGVDFVSPKCYGDAFEPSA
jgi:hypothetical protein